MLGTIQKIIVLNILGVNLVSLGNRCEKFMVVNLNAKISILIRIILHLSD